MKAVILVGGQGTRLRPITYEIPKPLVPVKKKPITNHLIELFLRHGIQDIALLASEAHRPDFMRWQKAWTGELPFEKVSIFYEETPRGTFGGFKLLRDWLGKDSFYVMNGDDVRDLDLGAMAKLHEAENAIGTVALLEVEDARQKGVVMLQGNKISQFLEKQENPPSQLINAGVYLFNPQVLDYADFNNDVVMVEKDIFPKLAALGRLAGYRMEGGRWYDCGTLEGWERAIKEW
jgi:NDP-sugar pyrophosphorylase family protein